MKQWLILAVLIELSAASTAQAQGPWLSIHRSDIAIVQIDTVEVLRGPNGALLVNLLRVYTEPQKSFDGTLHKYAMSRVEYDCAGRRHWLHVYWLGMNRETVEHKQYDNPTPLHFLPAGTLAGETALAVCEFLRVRDRA